MCNHKTIGALVATVLAGIGGAAAAQTQSPPIKWVNWSSATTGLAATATGALDAITVKYTGQINPAAQTSTGINYWSVTTPYLSAQVPNPPPDADIIRTGGGAPAGVYTVTFSQPVKNPVMAIVSLGNPRYPRTYEFIDAPFDVVSSGRGYYGAGSKRD